MKNILDYRMVILDKDANIIEYSTFFGMHQTCLDDFAKKGGYDYSRYDYLAMNGNVIFANVGLNILVVFLPNKLSDDQLYQMDYIHNWLGEVEMLEACKYLDCNVNHKISYQCTKNVSDYFSREIIQSYYSDNMTKKR